MMYKLTWSVETLLSSLRTAIPFTVVLTSGRVSRIMFSVVWPFTSGGGILRAVGLLGIQPPNSNWGERIGEKCDISQIFRKNKSTSSLRP